MLSLFNIVRVNIFLFLLLAFLLVSCNYPPDTDQTEPQTTEPFQSLLPASTITPSPVPARVLTICLGYEPASLFLYGDTSQAALAVRQAIYDGPMDVLGFEYSPVILEKTPSFADGDVFFEPIQVSAGDLIVDAQGNLVQLAEGVTFLSTGCGDDTCAQTYSGQDPVQMDGLVVHYKLRQDILWSDAQQVTAGDSQYSFEIATSIFPQVRSDLITLTQVYQALDSTTVEWKGVPGFRDSNYASNFFSPLPRHAWGEMSPAELLTADVSNRSPMGWGPYRIDEWVAGDYISLSRNSTYFRAKEGLPSFDKLIFRFIPDSEAALAELQAGKCDLLDETTRLESSGARLNELHEAGEILVDTVVGTAWEHADFGINSLDPAALPLFQSKSTRQAIAACIDRQRIVSELSLGDSQVPDSYIHPMHPLANPDVKRYSYDPPAGAALLGSTGWVDNDADPATPRISQGVPGVPDGTPLAFTFMTTTEAEKQTAARIIKDSLAECGIQVEVISSPSESLFAPGPDGPIFGRNFSMAQFNWATANQPPCFLYTTQEIPGYYPDYTKGWGGANASGYSSPEFDLACQQAGTTSPESPEHQAAHYQAQAIFTEDLPAIPLYLRTQFVAMRPDMCAALPDPSAGTILWNLESFDYGENCPQ